MIDLDFEKNSFEIGGDNLLAKTAGATTNQKDADDRKRQAEALDDIRVRVGTLLKTETVSILLGAGASVHCGGQLIGSIPLALERDLPAKGIAGTTRPRIRRWLTTFYRAAQSADQENAVPVTREAIIARRERLEQLSRIADRDAREKEEWTARLQVNFEHVLTTLHSWCSALSENGRRLRIDGATVLDARTQDINSALENATGALARTCVLPAPGRESSHTTYKTFVRKLLMRPLNLKRVNIFTVNYDTLVEQAADAEGLVLIDGFVGTQRRVFRPESYEQDLYFPAETTEGRVHRFDRVLHLYKLHGSITWRGTEPTIDDPYGVQSVPFDPAESKPLLIYPTPAKWGQTLGMPYSELMRRFAAALARPQSVLFAIGYGFGDEHVNAIIRQALAIPSFTLVIVDPVPTSDFVKKLAEQRDRRVWISRGPCFGAFEGFVEHVLPDLRDEEIRKKVLATHRALTGETQPQRDGLDDS